ncbi:ankyrin repeat-containing protein At2g01680-like isoform X2 [Neltuma alba]|uniref:ankyrin repeat-containing protein At2g01680-like isoform X2 n=1 Tax=Neltuma alba TaxID=207710 RepID=UPI0010A2C959|nr:ankyrin repeat-containing protein At2g01680-like isoform X2 [Prosopis alba]
MEITADNASFSKTEATKITTVEPVSDPDNYTIVTITGMKPEFHKAAVEGNINLFKEKGEPIESILTPNKNTILHIHFTKYTDSVSEKFVEEVLHMCRALLLKTNGKGDTILHIAARYGHHEIVKKLIACARDSDIYEVGTEKRLIRATNNRKDTALHEAARYGHNEVVDVMIKEEPDHTYFGKNVDDETPLYIAVERQNWDMVHKILDQSSSPQYNGPNGRNALHAAVLHGDTGQVRKLLTRNLLAAKEADENGWVPLHLAALCARPTVLELLVSKDRGTAYMRDNKGRTALHFAALADSVKMRTVLNYCPDCYELVDEKGLNALHYITMGETHSLRLLKQIIQDTPLSNLCNEKDDDGNTPLHLLARQAPKRNRYHPLLDLQFPKVDTMACNKYGQTALDVAVDVVPPNSADENTMLKELRAIGARLGGRVLDKHLKEKKQEKRYDLAVGEEEKQYKTNGVSKKYKTNDQDRLAGMATTLSVVATLIATVTFAAGFTLPGGLIQEGEHQGSPILEYNAAFIAFVLTDSLSFVLSISVVFFLFFSSALAKEKDAKQELSEFLLFNCGYLTMVAMGFMITAFGTGIYTVLGVSKGFGIVTLFIVLSFFFIIAIVFKKAFFGVPQKSAEKSLEQDLKHGVESYDNRESDIQLSQIV